MEKLQEKRIFLTYEIALFLKGVQAFLEIVSGILFYAISTNAIATFIVFIANGELAESPDGILSNFLIQSAHQLSASGKFFITFYLLTHGIVKLVLIIGLFLKKPWAYPGAIIGLGGLILYQIYSLITHYSVFLLILTIIDIIILWLIVREHNYKDSTASMSHRESQRIHTARQKN
jgi:uncharacterized membrane protein